MKASAPESRRTYRRVLRRGGRRLITAVTVLLAILLSAFPVAAEKVGWRTTDRASVVLYKQITDLYLSLYNTGILPVVEVSNPEGLPVATLARNRKVIFGDVYPQELDALLCDLNAPTLCTRPLKRALAKDLVDAASPVGGAAATAGVWKIQKDQNIKLPDVAFTETFQVLVADKKAGTSIQSILERVGGCEKFDAACKEFLTRLNKYKPEAMETDYAGEVRVPALSLTAVIDTECEQRNCVGSYYVRRLNQAQRDAIAAVTAPGDLKTLNRNLWTGIDASAQAAPNVTAAADTSVKDFINFPFAEVPFPDPYRKVITIGVVDGPIDAFHCSFKGRDILVENISASVTALGTPISAPPGDCTDWTPGLGLPSDHGTHVVGIIASALRNRSGGLNPYAKIRASVVTEDGLKTLATQNALAAKLADLYRDNDLRVVNMSHGYDPDTVNSGNGATATVPLLQSVIEDTLRDVLCVVAAGQSAANGAGQDLDQFCSVYPACLRFDNVLPVVALENGYAGAAVPTWANYDAPYGIGALGKGVYSTGTNNKFVLLDGSSMAAPQVTAVAALLAAGVNLASPSQIKARLIACAKPVGPKVWSGRLDAACTLDRPRLDRVEFADGAKVVNGKIMGVVPKDPMSGRIPLSKLPFRVMSTGERIGMTGKFIYAIRRTQSGGLPSLTLLLGTATESRLTLERHDDVWFDLDSTLLAADPPLAIREVNGAVTQIPLSKLSSYVSRIIPGES